MARGVPKANNQQPQRGGETSAWGSSGRRSASAPGGMRAGCDDSTPEDSNREPQVFALRHDADDNFTRGVRLAPAPSAARTTRLEVGRELRRSPEDHLAAHPAPGAVRAIANSAVVRGQAPAGITVLPCSSARFTTAEKIACSSAVKCGLYAVGGQAALDLDGRHDELDVFVLGFLQDAIEVAQVVRIAHRHELARTACAGRDGAGSSSGV